MSANLAHDLQAFTSLNELWNHQSVQSLFLDAASNNKVHPDFDLTDSINEFQFV
jgi:hypothetical protein